MSDRVILTGVRSDIPRIMAASDIVVHSASEPEPFGRVIVEAMAAGRPVVATAAGGVLDIIEDQVTGLLVPSKNVTLMAKAIQQFLQNEEQVGGFPVLDPGTPCADTDHDGIPDAWELGHGLNPNDAADRNLSTLSSAGYTNLEAYLSGLYGCGGMATLVNIAENWLCDVDVWTRGDLTGDGQVDLQDYARFAAEGLGD